MDDELKERHEEGRRQGHTSTKRDIHASLLEFVSHGEDKS